MPVHLQQSARDLQEIAKTVVANPTVGKKILHSSFLSSHRSAVQSKGAFASYAGKGIQKGVSIALNQIPIPLVGSVLDKAWTAACEAIRSKVHQKHVDYPGNVGERVKFELKEISSQVEDWDRYRWKVAHAVEQYNKVCTEVQQGISSAPCDTWVRVWAKYYYLGSRIGKLRESIEAMRAIVLEVDVWLDSVEQSYGTTHQQIKTLYDRDAAQLKTMQVHDTCADTKCMFKQGQWTNSMSVPTSDAAKFFIQATSTALKIVADDPISDAVNAATS
ncbi:MAG: hypothetical protein ABSF71_12110 [Terriglobia bacterium]|jgi:hypothetical protein